MGMSQEDDHLGRLEHGILTVLIDSDQSFATLLSRLLDLELGPHAAVSSVLPVLDELERRGLVKIGIWTSDSRVGTPPRNPTPAELTRERSRFQTLADAAAEKWPFIGLWLDLRPRERDAGRKRLAVSVCPISSGASSTLR
jgi:hypothetical protein